MIKFEAFPRPMDAAARMINTMPPTLKTVMKSLKPVPDWTARTWIATRSQTSPTALRSMTATTPPTVGSSAKTGKKWPR